MLPAVTPCSVISSLFLMRPRTEVSSANLTSLMAEWLEVQSLVRGEIRGEDTSLWSSGVGSEGSRQVAANPHLLFLVGEKICNPLTDGSGYLQL